LPRISLELEGIVSLPRILRIPAYINDILTRAYIPMSKICKYLAARRESSGSCRRARRSGSENPQIKAIGMWQSSSRRTHRWRCRPTSCGLPDPHDCEHKVSRALTVRSREWDITSQFLGIWLSLLSWRSLTQVPTLSLERVNLIHTSQFSCPQMPQRQHTGQS
jgi:hypothetical protein